MYIGDGPTALWLASRLGSPKAVKVLLDAGADKDGTTGNGHTALFAAVVRILLDAGADKAATCAMGRFPLYVCLANGV